MFPANNAHQSKRKEFPRTMNNMWIVCCVFWPERVVAKAKAGCFGYKGTNCISIGPNREDAAWRGIKDEMRAAHRQNLWWIAVAWLLRHIFYFHQTTGKYYAPYIYYPLPCHWQCKRVIDGGGCQWQGSGYPQSAKYYVFGTIWVHYFCQRLNNVPGRLIQLWSRQ